MQGCPARLVKHAIRERRNRDGVRAASPATSIASPAAQAAMAHGTTHEH
jgi:hypothetical protein